MTQTLFAATASALLFTATPAEARGPAPAALHVVNHYAAPVQVRIDGRFAGQVDQDARFRVHPGVRTVQITTLDGYPLTTSRERLRPRQGARLDVHAPPTTIAVRNSGATPLLVQGGVQDLWVAPFDTAHVHTLAGPVRLTAMARDRRGRLHLVAERAVFAHPGQPNRTSFRWDQPVAPLVVSHHDRHRRYDVSAPPSAPVRPGPARPLPRRAAQVVTVY